MNFIREKLSQLSRAMEFANVDTYYEFNRLLESHEEPAAAVAAPAPSAPKTAARSSGYDAVIDFAAFAQRAGLRTAGQH